MLKKEQISSTVKGKNSLNQRIILNFLMLFLLTFLFIKVNAQEVDSKKFDDFVDTAILLSEEALYNATFDEALAFVDISYFKNFNSFKIKHKIALIVQGIRIQSFKARLNQTSFDTDVHLNKLKNYLPHAEKLKDSSIKANFFVLLSSLYYSKNHDLGVAYEKRALDIFKKLSDSKSIAVLQANILSRELSNYLRDDEKQKAIKMIPRFREEIAYSTKHSKLCTCIQHKTSCKYL